MQLIASQSVQVGKVDLLSLARLHILCDPLLKGILPLFRIVTSSSTSNLSGHYLNISRLSDH